jgi:hypothetical protein
LIHGPENQQFVYTPSPMLMQLGFPSWQSNVIELSSGLPIYSQLFVLKFDVISALKYNPNEIFDYRFGSNFISFETLNLSNNFMVNLSIASKVVSDPTNVGVSTIMFTLIVEKEGDAKKVVGTSFNIGDLNTSSEFMNKKLKDLGFNQFLSTMTIFLKVKIYSKIIKKINFNMNTNTSSFEVIFNDDSRKKLFYETSFDFPNWLSEKFKYKIHLNKNFAQFALKETNFLDQSRPIFLRPHELWIFDGNLLNINQNIAFNPIATNFEELINTESSQTLAYLQERVYQMLEIPDPLFQNEVVFNPKSINELTSPTIDYCAFQIGSKCYKCNFQFTLIDQNTSCHLVMAILILYQVHVQDLKVIRILIGL